jgi:hypothetical protein
MNKAIFGILLLSCSLTGCNKHVVSTLSETANNDTSAIKAACHQEADDYRTRIDSAYRTSGTRPAPDALPGSQAALYAEADQVYRDCLRRRGIPSAD